MTGDGIGSRTVKEEREQFMTTNKQALMLRLAPGLVSVPCVRCGEPVYRIIVNGKSVEADCGGPDGVAPTTVQHGYGVSHVSRCGSRPGKRA